MCGINISNELKTFFFGQDIKDLSLCLRHLSQKGKLDTRWLHSLWEDGQEEAVLSIILKCGS